MGPFRAYSAGLAPIFATRPSQPVPSEINREMGPEKSPRVARAPCRGEDAFAGDTADSLFDEYWIAHRGDDFYLSCDFNGAARSPVS